MMMPFYFCSSLVYTRNIYLTRYIIEGRNSRPEVFREKRVLRNFTKFTEKNLCQSLFFLKKDFGIGVFL